MTYTFNERERSLVAVALQSYNTAQRELNILLEGLAAAHGLSFPLNLTPDGSAMSDKSEPDNGHLPSPSVPTAAEKETPSEVQPEMVE